MPYSKKHDVLFIHIPKCAGKSFEVALNIATEKEVQKYRWRNNLNRASKLLLTLTRDRKAIDRLWGTWDVSLAMQHLTFVEIEVLNLLSSDILKKSIKVAIVRNPFDRAISSYKHMGSRYNSFIEFLKNYYTSPNLNHGDLAHKRTQCDFLKNKNGELVIENILKFENLEKDFKKFKQKYRLDLREIPHIGKQKRDLDYRKYYCEESRRIVTNLFSEDISTFKYSF